MVHGHLHRTHHPPRRRRHPQGRQRPVVRIGPATIEFMIATSSTEVFACYSSACRPPTSGGTGGSGGKGGSRGSMTSAQRASQDRATIANDKKFGTNVQGVVSRGESAPAPMKRLAVGRQRTIREGGVTLGTIKRLKNGTYQAEAKQLDGGGLNLSSPKKSQKEALDHLRLAAKSQQLNSADSARRAGNREKVAERVATKKAEKAAERAAQPKVMRAVSAPMADGLARNNAGKGENFGGRKLGSGELRTRNGVPERFFPRHTTKIASHTLTRSDKIVDGARVKSLTSGYSVTKGTGPEARKAVRDEVRKLITDNGITSAPKEWVIVDGNKNYKFDPMGSGN